MGLATGEGQVKPPFRIAPARTMDELEAVADLFAAYAASLPVDLGYQGFDSELAGLPGKYAPPRGELLLVRDEPGMFVGCAGLRPLDEAGRCEMKRLYVIPAARSFGLGNALTQAIISEAERRGYSELFLDTLPTMSAAATLYLRMGFRRTGPYYGPTPPGTIFMRLKLGPTPFP